MSLMPGERVLVLAAFRYEKRVLLPERRIGSERLPLDLAYPVSFLKVSPRSMMRSVGHVEIVTVKWLCTLWVCLEP